MKRTRAIQILEDAGIRYRVTSYDADGFASAVEVAKKLQMPANAIFKTLLVKGERSGIVMVLVPGDCTLDLRKLAHLLGDKKVEMVDPADLTRLTGYVRGGVSPLGGKRAYPTLVDETAFQHETICVSAGIRGVQVHVAPADLLRLTNGKLADLLERES